jgi:hypothetical protein
MYQPNRIQPNLPVHGYQTFQIVAPVSTHWRAATCEEADCLAMQRGWTTTVDEQTDLGKRQAHYIRREAKRSFVEEKRPDGLTAFKFKAGQNCFREHKVRVEREEIFVRRDGDWRGNPTQQRTRYDRADQWVSDFAEHQDNLARHQQRG